MNEDTARLVVDGVEHKIAVKDITIICPSADFNSKIEYPDAIPLTAEDTLYHMGKVQKFHFRTPALVARIFGIEDDSKITPEWCRKEGTGVRHAAGLIDLTVKLMEKGLPVVWVYPESFLHPKAQCQLADVLSLMVNYPKEVAKALDEAAESILHEKDT